MQSGCLGKGSVPIGDGLDACQEIEGLLILPLAGCSALVQLVPRLTAGCSALLPAPSLGPPCPEHIGHHASALYIGTTGVKTMPTHIVGPKSLAGRLGNPKPTPMPF